MARTSAKAKKQKQDVNKTKTEVKNENETQETKPTIDNEENVHFQGFDNEDSNGSTDKENDSTNYEVEKIVHTRVYHGKRQFLVRWKGYKEDSDTWENESMLQSCSEVLEAFQRDNPKLIEKDNEKSESEADKESDTEKGKTQTKKGGKTKQIKKDNEQSESEAEKESDTEKGKTQTKTKKRGKAVGKKSKKSSVVATEDVEIENDQDEANDENTSGEDTKTKKKGGKRAKKTKQETKDPPKKRFKHLNSKKDNNEDSESDTDGKNYEVEKIIEVHTRKNGNREFLIRWKGYRPSDDTWEPEEHLDCPDLIEKFMEKVDKAKKMPTRELREARTPTQRYVPNHRGKHRSQRHGGLRLSYQE